MKVLFFIVAIGALGTINIASVTDGQFMLTSLLQAHGYSDTCVAKSLNDCSRFADDDSGDGDDDIAALIKEAVQEAVQEVKGMVQETRGMVQQLSLVLNKLKVPPSDCKDSDDPEGSGSGQDDEHPSPRPRHCKDLLDSGDSGSGVHHLYPFSERPNYTVPMYCRNSFDNGGWTVIQRRTNNTVRLSFDRTWDHYVEGFGDPEGEYWMGLDLLYTLTSNTTHELRVDLEDYEGERRWAKYGIFHVDGPETNYRLNITRYSGDAGDSMGYNNGQEFSTHDADHDKRTSVNCAERYRGGWWYYSCTQANLNGYQHVGQYPPTQGWPDGIMWHHWRGWGYSLKGTTMMIRPAQ